MDESLVVRRETHIAAPPATVFAFLTDPDKILRWMGTDATADAHPGGLYLVKSVGGNNNARGAFREVVPVHRLAYSFGWEGREDVPPGSSLVEIDLIERNGGTLLRMTHTGLPNAEQVRSHGKVGPITSARLAVAAAGGDPGPDPGPQHPPERRNKTLAAHRLSGKRTRQLIVWTRADKCVLLLFDSTCRLDARVHDLLPHRRHRRLARLPARGDRRGSGRAGAPCCS